MSYSAFKHVKISGILGVIPKNCINIDDEIQYYKNDENILNRNKKILKLGQRYVIDEGTTTSDLIEDSAERLIKNLKINKDEIESLIVVSTSHDYAYPATACILHGRLGLKEECMCFDISGLACSGYVYALNTVFSLIESKAVKNCLLLCGDIVSTHSNKKNRKINMLFSDMGTATFIEYSDIESPSYFYLGTRGKDWQGIIAPASGYAFPLRKDIADLEILNEDNDVWHMWEDIMHGMDVFKFTMDVGPESISKLLKYSSKTIDDIDFFAIHQANGQIVNTVANHAKLPKEKYSYETFTKYANCSTASVVSVLLDKCKDKKNVFLCTFGVGLSFSNAIINLQGAKNYGIEFYEPKRKPMTRMEQIDYWIKSYKGI